MDTLRERLAHLADEAPTGGAPPAELWARGRRAHRRRVAVVTAAFLVVGALGTGLGVRLADGDGRTELAPAGQDPTGTDLRVSLPITYPVGEDLPDLGSDPGPLAAIWLAPRAPYTPDDDVAGPAPEAVGLVAETGAFGTLPLELSAEMYEIPDVGVALSPDGRRIAFNDEDEGLVVVDLVTGERLTPIFPFEVRGGYKWIDDTRLVGHVAGGYDTDGWLWEVGSVPERVNPYPYLDEVEKTDPPVLVLESELPWECRSPSLLVEGVGERAPSVLCDVVDVVDAQILVGHWNSPSPDDDNDAVVAVDVGPGAAFPFDDPDLRQVVVEAGAPRPVSFATELIGDALEAAGGAS